MRIKFLGPLSSATAIVAAAGILAGGVALRPAFAVGGIAQLGNFSVIHCSNVNPCQTYSNSGGGPGVLGIDSNVGNGGAAVRGNATKNGMGVQGSAIDNAGVSGASQTNAGISGTASNSGWGVYGYGYGGSEGVHGQSVDSVGGDFYSGSADGVFAASGSGIGLTALSESNATAISAIGGTGDGIDSSTDGGAAFYGNNIGGNGLDVTGSFYGLIGRAPSAGYPLVLTDTLSNTVFFVDGTGNVFYHGTIQSFSKTRRGGVSNAFAAQSSRPTLEDDGTAHLANGYATVALDVAFADAIDMTKAYRVMLTPDGDTRGLYVASKTSNGFVVREVQGGRSTLDFDYHIYATELGHAGQRMSEMTPAQAKSTIPGAPWNPRPVQHLHSMNRPH